jgi:hypothetical protein
MTVYAIGATSLIGGGTGALDAEYADNIGDGDPAFVIVKGDRIYHFIADATSGAAESSPDVIAPDWASAGVAYTGDLRWLLTSLYRVVGTSGAPVASDIAKFTDADTIEGRSYAELKADLNLEIGTDVLAQQTIGIADDNLVEVDDASVADNDFAKFTANGLEGRSYADTKADLDLEAGTDFYSKTAEDTWRNSVTQTEMGYVDGVTSDVQDQFDAKAPIADPTFTGEIGIGAVNVSETELGILEGATLTTTELNYVDGVTSSVQTQMNTKVTDAEAIVWAIVFGG